MRRNFSMYSTLWSGVSHLGQGEVECRALIDDAFGRTCAAMPMHDALDRCQSYAGALEFFGQMQTLENAKQLVRMAHVETRAVVPDEYFHLIIFLLAAADLDFGLRLRSRELDRVGKQINKNHPQHGAVSVTHRKRADLPGNIPSFGVLRELRDDLGDKRLQVYGAFSGLGTPDSGKAQQIIDQSSHPPGGFQDGLQVMTGFFVQGGSRLLLQQFGVADDMAKRRAQIMRYRIGERFQLPVGRLQFDGVFCQFSLGAPKIFLNPVPNRTEAGNGESPNRKNEEIRQVSAGNCEGVVGFREEIVEA